MIGYLLFVYRCSKSFEFRSWATVWINGDTFVDEDQFNQRPQRYVEGIGAVAKIRFAVLKYCGFVAHGARRYGVQLR